MWINGSSTTAYSKLEGDEIQWKEERPSDAQRTSILGTLAFILICFVAGFAGSFTAQVASYHVHTVSTVPTSQALELETIAQTFHYNRSFSYPPSNHTDRAWRKIFPKHGGFFVHPTIAPTRSTFSVYHQLHCLNGLRGGYFANQIAASEGRKLTDEDLPVDLRPSHMRHCIDLLRQVLMCQADTTLEVVDERINGVHGFRTLHTCKNWEQLRDWTTEWQQKSHVQQIE